jgi:predicted RNA-binding Zn-ribbon protein involved in translation (DUF1610 family)
MDVRFTLQKVKPIYVAIPALIICGIAIFMAVKSAARPSDPTAGNKILLKCVNPECGEVVRMALNDVIKGQTIRTEIAGTPGVKCPKCGHNTLARAYECPNDHTIFTRTISAVKPLATGAVSDDAPSGGTAELKCPKCGWDPITRSRPAQK